MNELQPPQRQIVSVTVSPKFDDDWDKLQHSLTVLTQQDQSMRVTAYRAERRVIISGMGELHLEIICDRLVREFDVALDIEKAKVTYLESIRQHSEAEAKYIRQVGGRGQYAHLKLDLEPAERNGGYQFVDQSPNGTLPRHFVEAIDSGIQEALKAGVLAGNEIVDVLVVLRDGSYHEADSNEMAFKIAASTAFKEAARKANPAILEPLMSIKVFAQEDLAGWITGDLSSRRGRIERIETRAGSVVIHAAAPLAELLGYASHLRTMTQGRSSYDMQFARYEVATDSGGTTPDEIGVPANKPTRPRPRSGFAAAKPDETFD
jgi:elongation factor G